MEPVEPRMHKPWVTRNAPSRTRASQSAGAAKMRLSMRSRKPPCPGSKRAGILLIGAALDGGFDKVANLPRHGDPARKHNCFQVGGAAGTNAQIPSRQAGSRQSCDCAFPGLARRDAGKERARPKGRPTDTRRCRPPKSPRNKSISKSEPAVSGGSRLHFVAITSPPKYRVSETNLQQERERESDIDNSEDGGGVAAR